MDVSGWLDKNVVNLLTLVVLVIVGWQLRERIRTLESTVKTQKDSLDAQGQVLTGFQKLVDGTRQALEMLDTPQMVARYAAYKTLTDQHAEAVIAEVRRQAEQEKRTMSTAAQAVVHGFVMDYAGLLVLARNWMPFVPVDRRESMIQTLTLQAPTRNLLIEAATKAPPPEPTFRQLLSTYAPPPSVVGKLFRLQGTETETGPTPPSNPYAEPDREGQA